MTWFKVDDSLPDHPKTVALEESKHFGPAMGLWAVAGSWCAKHLTDGAVPKRLIRKLGFRDAHAAALVAVGFWDTITDGYQFHNWLKWQPSKLSVTAKREATAARVQRHRNSSGAGGSNGTGSAPCNAVTNAVSNAPIDPGPTRPVPTRPEAKASTPQPPTGGEGLWVERFDPARASEYLVPLRQLWGEPFPDVHPAKQIKLARRMHDWCEGMDGASAAQRLATLGPWSRRGFQPKNKVELLLTGSLSEALEPERNGKASGYTEPAKHGEFSGGDVEI